MRPDILGGLEDILRRHTIEEDISDLTFDRFMADRRRRQSVERNVESLGEAINRLRRHASDVASQITAADQIVAFRTVLAHGYDVIDYDRVWFIIRERHPVLRSEIEQILREAEPDAQ